MSAPMVQAILAGRKTQTRRIVKVCPKKDGVFVTGRSIIPETYSAREGVVGYYPSPDGSEKGRASYVVYLLDGMGLAWRPYGGSPDVPWLAERIGEVSPYGGPGDLLWARETFVAGTYNGGAPWVRYAATDQGDVPSGTKWRPSIFMPRWASRITLEVTDVRVQRLQEISEEDARAEGVEPAMVRKAWGPHQEAYEQLWDSINGERAPWSSNPWVWVIAFRRVEAQPAQGGEGA